MKASDWISVKDKLPKLGECVLVCIRRGGEEWIEIVTLTKNSFNERRWYDVNGFDVDDITHWQRIIFPKLK